MSSTSDTLKLSDIPLYCPKADSDREYLFWDLFPKSQRLGQPATALDTYEINFGSRKITCHTFHGQEEEIIVCIPFSTTLEAETNFLINTYENVKVLGFCHIGFGHRGLLLSVEDYKFKALIFKELDIQMPHTVINIAEAEFDSSPTHPAIRPA